MQDRYVGDMGDYVKLALLRTLSAGKSLGVAWYRHPDETRNSDGSRVAYLTDPQRWGHYDRDVFLTLGHIVSRTRSISAIESSGILAATFHGEPLLRSRGCGLSHAAHRALWFSGACSTLKGVEIVFADPDNGLLTDPSTPALASRHAKYIRLSEVWALAAGRVGVFYHHNNRSKGGHDREVERWLCRLGKSSFAIRASAYGCRTFFVVNPDDETRRRAADFCQRWATAKVRLQHLNEPSFGSS